MKKDSKTKLLEAGLKEFSKNGYLGATTRDISQRAGLNISSIMYYYNGKKGLYASVLELIVKAVEEQFVELHAQYSTVGKDAIKAKSLLQEFVSKFLSILVNDDLSKDVKTLFFSEYFKPSEDFNILYDGLILPFHKRFAHLLILASGGVIKKQDSLLYIFPIFAQLFMISSRKSAICQLMNWSEIGDKERKKLLKSIYNQIDSLILPQ
ncbi:MAG: CerR family C-terminal domain-containing protein [Alphaproteobacteria bacterium]